VRLVGVCTRAERIKRSRIQTPLAQDPEHSVPAASAAFLTDRSIDHCWTKLCNIKALVSTDTHYSVAALAARQSPVTATVFINQRTPQSSQLTFVWLQTGSIRSALSHLNIYGLVHLRDCTICASASLLHKTSEGGTEHFSCIGFRTGFGNIDIGSPRTLVTVIHAGFNHEDTEW